MSARTETLALMQKLSNRGIHLAFDDANTLRRAELTLQRWAELECGDGNEWGSWAIERDENQTPHMVHHHYLHGKGKDWVSHTRIADREAGALRRVKSICERMGLHYYHQTDPRGCALYVSNEPIPDDNYTRAISVCA